MNWLLSILVGILTGVAGCFGAGFVASLCVRWYRISGFEGGSGYYVVFIALLGAVVGFITGVVCARAVGFFGTPSFPKALGLALGSMSALVLLAGVLARLGADIEPEMDGASLELAIEVRGPKDFTVPKEDDQYGAFACVYLPRGRHLPSGKLRREEARQEDGRWIITATVPLTTSARSKYLRVYFNKENDVTFPLPLRSHPNRSDLEWSKWVSSAWDAGKPEPPPEGKFNLRYRVQLEEPPPPPDPANEREDRFAALTPDAPLEDWLAFISNESGMERMNAVMQIIEGRQTDLATAIRSSDSDLRERALRAVTMLVSIAPEISAAVLSDGKEVAAGVRAFNGMKEEAEDFYDVQIALRSRFSYWHHAWWRVHQKTGVDGRPAVQEILDLALVRARGTSMDEIVINARAHLDGIKPATKKAP